VSPLVLADVPEPFWQAFQASRGDRFGASARGSLSGSRATPEQLRPTNKSLSLSTLPGASAAIASVVARWRRAASLGVSAEGPEDEHGLLRGPALRERESRAGLDRFHRDSDARRILEHASHELSLRDFTLLLADSEGVVLRRLGGGAFAPEARRVRLIEGAAWGESARGTNAIGTALAEARSVEVHGRSHFGRRFHGLCCYATPIRAPGGSIAFVLDATSFAQRADGAVGGLIENAARALEDVLRGHAYASAGASVARLLSRTFDRLAHPVLLVEAPGRVVRVNEAARERLGNKSSGILSIDPNRPLGDGLLPLSLAEALGDPSVDYAALVAEALRPDSDSAGLTMRRSADGSAFQIHVDPVETATGALLGVVVHLQPAHPRHSLSGLPTAPSAALEPPVPSVSPARSPLAPPTTEALPNTATTFFGDTLFAQDPTLQRAAAFATRVAKSVLPVMLLAETGTGKELFARGIHHESDRAQGAFIALNCGALAAELLTSELFGHGPSAFTGAAAKGKHGLLHAAQGGTLFLDEVAEMPAAMQAALLRVLEDGTYQRVGETETRHTDVRLIAATCRDLEALVEEGTFRKDLYYRLRGVTVRIPPLRARTDRGALVDHLLARLSPSGTAPRQVDPALRGWLETRCFRGNVRELRSLLSVTLVLAGDAEVLSLEHLPPDWATSAEAWLASADEAATGLAATTDEDAAAPGELRAVTGKLVRDTLSELSGNVSAAARKLGVARSTLYRRLRKRGASSAPEPKND
jgi:sigma-54 dependent transcriptional regulator, acetoin dehydrogenase operon transcriptional activator AcoR